jgi:2'-5' RNA ligase
VRLFVAVEIEEPVRIAAVDAAGRLRARLSRQCVDLHARWVPVDNLHLTLWFIGEVDEVRGSAVLSALLPPFPHEAFDVHIGGLGAFPPSGAPRVLWLGVRAGQDALRVLHAETGARLRPLPAGSGPIVRAALAGTPADAGRTTVSAVTLFRSRVSSKGSTYEPVARVPLKQA